MYSYDSLRSKQAFTLIELLVVIAIIAILAVVVVLTLNPAEMLRQARDANRLSDLATINSAINLYTTDQSGSSGFSLGNASNIYLSLSDTSSTCSNLGLATTSPSSVIYACVNSTSSRNINNSGWIPVNLSLLSSGSPLGSLPIDPVNQSSTGLYYTYYTNGSQFEVTSLFESQKNKTQYGQKPIVQNLPELNAQGSSLSINPLFNPTGLVGYWPMDEGSGSSTQDLSGNNNLGTWSGSTTNGNYYTGGKVGSYAGMFDGSTTYVGFPNMSSFQNGTISFWVKTLGRATAPVNNQEGKFNFANYSPDIYGTGVIAISWSGASTPYPGNYSLPDNAWTYVTVSWTGAGTGAGYIYVYSNAQLKMTVVETTMPIGSGYTGAGSLYGNGNGSLNGLMDDIRIYNRALSPAEIQATYNAEK
jgi:prepilin-type N-terminal cleavage/methylation domain-containing protein